MKSYIQICMNKLFMVCLKCYILNLRIKGLLISVRLIEESMMSGYEALRVGLYSSSRYLIEDTELTGALPETM